MRPLTRLAILLLFAAAPARAAQPTDPALVLRGKVVDMTGTAVARARFVIDRMKKRSSASVDRSGAFALMIPLPTPEALRAAPCSLRVFATTKGMRLVLPNGDPALSVSLRIVHSDSTDKVVARSNDERVAAMAALAVATRRPLAEIDGLRMMGIAGERVGDPPPVAMPHVAQVAVESPPPPPAVASTGKGRSEPPKSGTTSPAGKTVALQSPAPVTPPASQPSAPKSSKSTKSSKPPAKSASAAKTPPSSGTGSAPAKSASAPVAIVSPPADPPPAAPPSSTPANPAPSDCGCRIKGTVELVSNPPPTEPVTVVVWVDGSPAIRDAIELALGSPRPFQLLDVPCGLTQLRVQVSAERSYLLQSPGMIEGLSCLRGGLLQPRIVLVPRKGF